jgi:phosphoglycerol transferase
MFWYSAGLVICVASLILCVRNTWIQNPLVMGDECYYSALSNVTFDQSLLQREASQLPIPPYPNFLYLRAVSFHGWFGESGFLLVKLLNSIVFSLSVIPIALLGRRVGMSDRAAVAIGAASLLFPANTYTAFFMPEPFYYTTFWWTVWAFVCFDTEKKPVLMALVGLLLALLFGIKAHASAILAVFVVALTTELLLPSPRPIRQRIRTFLVQSGTLTLSFGVAIFALQTLVPLPFGPASSGEKASGLFGLYSVFLSGSKIKELSHSFSPHDLAQLAKGHLMFLLPFFGYSLATTVVALRTRAQSAQDFIQRRIVLFVLLSTVILFFMVLVFTLMMNEVTRLYMRYYDFIFPGLLVTTFCCGDRILNRGTRLAFCAVSLLCCATAVTRYISFDGYLYDACFNDAPLIFGLVKAEHGRLLLGVTAIIGALTVLVGLDGRLRQWLYVSTLAATSLWGGVCTVSLLQRMSQDHQIFHRASAFVSSLTTPAERSEGVLVSRERSWAASFLFHFRSTPQVLIANPDAGIDLNSFPPDVKWVFVLWSDRVGGPHQFALRSDTGTFVRRSGGPTVKVGLPAK